MICGVEECTSCGRPVIRVILFGRDRLVDPVPMLDGDLELAGIRTLRKPIAIPHVGELPGLEPRYRCHPADCASRLVSA